MEDSNKVLFDILNERLELMRRLDKEGDSTYRRHVARETSELHAQLAHRLGLYQIKTEMEDLALKFTDYDTFKYIARALNAKKSERDAYIERFIAPIAQKLTEAGFVFTIKGRPKSIHSIYHKMQMQHCDVDKIYDLFAIRIILDSPPEREKRDCWQVYSLITDVFQPNPKRLRDWLSVPKENGYESLHTTVLGPDDRWVEVQIRSRRMDEVAEQGVAAHWAYKGVKGNIMHTDKQYVYVFTPQGDLRRLPAGATILDFAYSIHTEMAGHCVGGKILGKLVPIRHEVQNGDQIEILTSAQQHPNRDWLSFVVSHRARNKIKQAIARMEAENEPEVYESVHDQRENQEAQNTPAPAATVHKNGTQLIPNTPMSLEVTNLSGVDFHPASCCNPQPGDPIFGFISVTKGIRIHRQDCPNASYMRERFGYRVIPAHWKEKKEE